MTRPGTPGRGTGAPAKAPASAREGALANVAPLDEVDVAIVGGGLVGTPLALALAVAGWRVALLERERAPAPSPAPLDQRCTALAAGSVRWLERTGLWTALADDACAIRAVHVSHRGRFGTTRLTASELGLEALGQVVENRRVLAALAARLDAAGVLSLGGTVVDRIETGEGSTRVGFVPAPEGRDGRGGEAAPASRGVLRARLLIGVDGVDSSVRAALGIDVRRVDYRQSALLGTIGLARDHGHVAHERFTDQGPLALLPRPVRCASLVECAAPETARTLAALDDADYLAHLQRRFGHRLGRFERLGPRTLLPLVRVEAIRQVAPRAVLLGNAARLLHPIAGQGYNLALRDVRVLVETLTPPGGTRRLDPGAAEPLAAFADARRADQRRVVALTDLLARGFRGRNGALARLRALALLGLDATTPARRRFARRAAGLGH